MSEHGLVYISPLSRIFEFVCGMCIAAIYKRRNPNTAYWLATAYELGAVLLCAFAMFNMHYLIRLSHDLMLGTSMAMWLGSCGSFLAFGTLIYIVAHGRGLISKILATPGLVLLGEISFSIYLIHQILLSKYRQNAQMLSHLPDGFAFAIYMVIVLLAAYLIWFFVEMPGRRLMLGFVNGYGGAARKPWQPSNLVSKGKPLFAVLGLVCTFSFLNLTAVKATQGAASKLTPISLTEAESMTSASMKDYLGINFQNAFTVRGLDFKCKREGLYVYVTWQIISTQDVVFNNAVHLIDQAGIILSQADYKQSPEVRNLDLGSAWVDTIFIPNNKIMKETTSLALGIYDDAKALLVVDRGPSDWGGAG
ncbi:acyltransferase family protein [Ectopseudomonas guguanensis]|uniref:acyltransferase family protein n=1 Tax=Ectopseudomonas guguanensis TaxID=1198456 RepID=UPI0028630323|nr:acyltransferase [Pseudomonas guguanensis]MDR8017898.1 acyltransferase [Pseudomonas guguanensis]